MDSKENQCGISNENKNNEDIIENDMNPDKMVITSQTICKEKEGSAVLEDGNDDTLDVDLSTLEIASSLVNPNFSLEDSDLVIPDSMDEAYKDIITVCSSTAQSIKQTISDVLNSRERVVITEVDPTTELQESLNKKIADFENVVRGCLSNDKPVDPDLEKQPENDISCIETIKETPKEIENTRISVSQISEQNAEVLQDSASIISSNVTVSSSPEKSETYEESKSVERKSESIVEIPIQGNKMISTSQFQTSNSSKETLKSTLALDEEKIGKKQKNVLSKKKGEKNIDQILKSLGNGTSEEKLHILTKKHMETLEELRLVEPRLKQLERQIITQQREKEQLQAEHNRMILAKSRLEGLCREMQRQSKAVKEESLLRIKEEEEKRKEIANKFQATLNDISSLMQENSKKNSQLREENAELATKLKSLVDNYEVWEQNMSKIVQQKELEAQLAKAKHAKVNLLLKQETEKFLREKQSLLENLSELQKRCALLAANELQLRTELADYTSKYEEFQNVLSNSSKVFATFKNDMESTSKKIKKLEKETNVYKQKWESSNNALLDMISHKEKQDKEVANAQQRILTLEKLCRALQAERNELQNQLNIATSNSVPTTSKDVPSLTTEAGVA